MLPSGVSVELPVLVCGRQVVPCGAVCTTVTDTGPSAAAATCASVM